MLTGRFLTYLQHEKRYSPHTVTAYQSDLQQFKFFLNDQFELDFPEAKAPHIRSFMASLLDQGTSANAIGRKISTLRSFYKFLLREELLKVNPVSLVRSPKVPSRLPVFVAEHKIDELLDGKITADGEHLIFFKDDFEGQRDKLVIELLFGTGIRLAELLQLDEMDIDYYQTTIKVLGKRNKERIIPVHQPLIELVKKYLSAKSTAQFNNKSKQLIVTNKGEAAYPKLIYRIVNEYLNNISTQDKKSPHVLRHSFASSLLNRGADLNAIKELLGHSSLAATQVYTHNSVERLKSIYKQAHPKA